MLGYSKPMQWGHFFNPVGLATALLVNGLLAFPAQAKASLGAPATSATSPQFYFILITLLAIGVMVAVAWRLWAVHRERDAVRDKVAAMEVPSERDALTGLLNRHVVEERFETLRAQGFDTFALIDLDNFKAVNDRHGHQVGDEVLAACGHALKGGEGRDYLTIRHGAEEFVVLLSGVDAYYRAEALRKKLPMKIARAVPALEEPVTASMGLIEFPDVGFEASSFEELYERAAQLLRNAKAAGRDRTCFERLTMLGGEPAPAEQNSASRGHVAA